MSIIEKCEIMEGILMNIDTKHKKIIEIVQYKLTCSAHDLDYIFRI